MQAFGGNNITSPAQLGNGVVTSEAIAADVIVAGDVADNAIGDGEIAAHTTTKITVPLSKVGAGTQGGLPYFAAAGAPTELAAGDPGQFLKTQGAGANPVWASPGTAIAASAAYNISSVATVRVNGLTTYTKVNETLLTSLVSGTLRVTWDMKVAGGTGYGRIYVNGVAVGIERTTTSPTYASFTDDITVVGGELVQLYTKCSISNNDVNTQNFVVSCDKALVSVSNS